MLLNSKLSLTVLFEGSLWFESFGLRIVIVDCSILFRVEDYSDLTAVDVVFFVDEQVCIEVVED